MKVLTYLHICLTISNFIIFTYLIKSETLVLLTSHVMLTLSSITF